MKDIARLQWTSWQLRCMKRIVRMGGIIIERLVINMCEAAEEKYLILCNRHDSVYGKGYALWWGYRNDSGGYSADFRNAHLFSRDKVVDHLNDKGDPAIKLSDLGYTEQKFNSLPQDENLRVLIEKGTLNELLKLNLKAGD